MRIFNGTSNPRLCREVNQIINNGDGSSPDRPKQPSLVVERFSDGEILPRFTGSIRDQDIFFIQSTDTSDAIVETLLVCDAAKRAGARSFTLVAPYMGYSRQDKTDHVRSSIGSKMLADVLEKVGVSRLFTIDLHASSIQGFYNTTVIHLNANRIFVKYVKSLGLSDLVICSPDQGAVKRNRDFAASFPDSTLAVINKRRVRPNEVHSMELIGDVAGKNVILVDDMADTLGTLRKASELLHECGARSIYALATHGILSGGALENLAKSRLTQLVVTDSVESVYHKLEANTAALGDGGEMGRLVVLSCANLVADSLERVHRNRSIHELNSVPSA